MRQLIEGGSMSATTATDVREFTSRTPTVEPRSLRALEFVGVIPVAAFIVWKSIASWPELGTLAPGLVAWLIVIAIADLMPIPIWGSVEIAISFPVLLAAAMVFPPFVACLLGFVGPFDVREIRREISVLRGLFNRANIAISVLAASSVYGALGGDLSEWPSVVGVAFLALSADVLVNGALVTFGAHLLTGVPASRVWRNISGGTEPLYFLMSYVAFGLVAVLLAVVHLVAGSWGLIVFAIPLLLARQMFVHWKRLGEASAEIAEKQRALVTVTERIADERKEERLNMAAGIHDEVLPPLYQVHLMGQILKQDLASGRLLELEADLPELLRATDRANEAIRSLIRDLRQTSLDSTQLIATLRLLSTHLASLTKARFELELEDVGGAQITLLVAYQVAREALSNAARHSNAATIRLFLGVRDGSIRLVVRDDGKGFDPTATDRVLHFGLQLMRERVELVGGVFYLESSPGQGTTIVARLPLELDG
jgi:signal transduction histidine kinase